MFVYKHAETMEYVIAHIPAQCTREKNEMTLFFYDVVFENLMLKQFPNLFQYQKRKIFWNILMNLIFFSSIIQEFILVYSY